jgi:hypothetical protein
MWCSASHAWWSVLWPLTLPDIRQWSALDEATHPALHVLAQLVHSRYPDDLKERMAVFVEVIA